MIRLEDILYWLIRKESWFSFFTALSGALSKLSEESKEQNNKFAEGFYNGMDLSILDLRNEYKKRVEAEQHRIIKEKM